MTDALVAIQQVYARYSISLDAADLAEFATCFTADPRLQIVGGPTFEGQDGLAALIGGRKPESPRHETTNVCIDLDGDDRARGRAYFVLRGPDGQPAAMGTYADELARDADGWKFAARRISFSWRAQ